MKKSLIALAVLAASGVASAQTATVYGLVDAWVGTEKDAATGVSNTKVNSGGFNGSRWGIRGSEDLGGGLKANFQLEQGFNVDTGAGTAGQAFSRQSWIGLSGGFGAVKVGKTWTAFDDLYGATNFSFDSNLSATGQVLDTVNYQDRPGNTIRYESPDFDGINASVSYSFGENKTAALSAGNVTSFAISYAGGPVFVGLGYQVEKSQGGTPANLKYTRLNGSYDFGVAKLLLTYGKVSQSAVSDVTEYAIGADVPISGALTLSGGYVSSKEKIAATVEHTGYSITAKYDVSKRTFFDAGYERDKVKNAANAHTILAAGIQHRF